MLQQAKVVRIIDDNKAEISVVRASACGHDCESCPGCGMSSSPVNATAMNSIGAHVGDLVTVETDTTAVIGIAAVVYMLPLALFFMAYITCKAINFTDAVSLILGAVGFAAGVLCALVVNRCVDKNNSVDFKIISINSGEKKCLDM